MTRVLTLVLILTIVSFAQVSLAQDSLSFQGYLTDDLGNPIDSKVQLSFDIYKSGSSVWSETHSTVLVNDGVFNVTLGRFTPLDTVAFDEAMKLGISVGGDPEISPRTPLNATAHALSVRGLTAFWREDIDSNRSYNLIGGSANSVAAGVVGASIGGGGGFVGAQPWPNKVMEDWGTIGGGGLNTVSGRYAAIVGGSSNESGGQRSFIGAGSGNEAFGDYSTIGGGSSNDAADSYSTVGGGWVNKSTGVGAAIAGGRFNQAAGQSSTVPGGEQNRANGDYSFAAGYSARPQHAGSFVWADRSSTAVADSVETTGPNQFLIRAAGGVGIGTNSPDAQLDVAGGNNWNLVNTEGDFRIGDDTYRMEVGVSLGGAGAGTSRIYASGGTGRLVLGGNETDIVRLDTVNGLYPGSDDTFSLGTSSDKWTEVWATDGAINTSDRRLKQDVEDLSYGLDAVKELRPVRYRWKDRPADGDRLGLIAQETAEVIPEVVEVPDNPEAHLGMRYTELIPVLVKAVQELQATVEQQNQVIANQGGLIKEQDDRIEYLEKAYLVGATN